MTSQSSVVIEPEEKAIFEDKSEEKRVGVVSTIFGRISQFWPFRFTMRAFRGFWWFFGFSTPEKPLAPAEEVQSSPTKPCGKGSKRKQDDVEDEDEDAEQQSWVEALNQELDDEDAADPEDPDYEPSSIVTDSEEYRSHNNTDSDIEVDKGVAVIDDVPVVAASSDS